MIILHVITGLGVGGAELMLKRLIDSDPMRINQTIVVSLTSLGSVGKALRARNVRVHTLGMSSALDFPITLWRLVWLIRRYRPEVVQTWMYHADLLGGLAARISGSCSVFWGIRSTAIPQGPLSFTFWLVRLCALFSYFIPHKIICCAQSAQKAHIKLGYAAHKMILITNGYDFSVLSHGSNSRTKARRKLGLAADEIIIGTVGRFDPLKDFHNFVSAASNLSTTRHKIKFLMVGRNIDWSNPTLVGWIKSFGLERRFILVGEQDDVPFFLSAMDVFCLSSSNEAFPNVVVEAMGMERPCVVTRAGDAAIIVGDEEFVVPVKDSLSLSIALQNMCDLSPEDRKKIGQNGSKRVRAEYGIENILRKYQTAYGEIFVK